MKDDCRCISKGRTTWELRDVACIRLLLCSGLLLTLGVQPLLHAAGEEGAPITLGMSTALTGPAAFLGLHMHAGVSLAFEEANRDSGVHGRPLRLVALDDGYEPSRTVPNMRTLIEEEKVLAVIGNVGTPTAVAAVPMAIRSKTPFIAPFTGAGMLRKRPPDRYVVNYRASYGEETGAMVDALVDVAGIGLDEIAFFTQRDAYGDAGYTGGLAALKRHGLEDESHIAHGRYERNTLVVENALADILLHEPLPRAVIMVGAYAPSVEFIKLSKEYGLDALFLNISFVGATALAEGLGDTGEGVIVTQVVPHFESEVKIVEEYRAAMKQYSPKEAPTCISLEGYVAGRILLLALESAAAPQTSEALIDSLEGLGQFDIGLGVALRLGPDEHQACHDIWPTVIRGGKVVPFDWSELSSLHESERHD